jgi:hypothetical protein
MLLFIMPASIVRGTAARGTLSIVKDLAALDQVAFELALAFVPGFNIYNISAPLTTEMPVRIRAGIE